MQERVRLLHGAITFESSPDCGTIVTVTIPVSVPSGVGVAAPGDGASSTVSATR
jgi:signal transduction histidine kinase